MSDLMRTDNLDHVQLTFFEDIKKMSRSLLEIINDILDFSKIEAGKLELVPLHFDIVSLFDNIASLCAFLAEGKSLEFRSGCAPDVPKILYGDETRIRQIFTNVVNNAIKYTREGHVNFTLKLGTLGTSEEQEYLIATVEDSGIGIKDEDKAKLFGSFEQLDARKNRSVTGTGLGLAITKRLLDMMGGIVEVESEYGKGTCFTIYIPLVAGDPAQVEQNEEGRHFVKAAPGTDIQILVVDDMPINLTVALGFLARHEIKADTAGGGEEAVRMVREKRYDMVLMDHMMPEVDGIEAARRIRAWEDEQRALGVPIVALSANAVTGARELFIEAGMNDFISKPIEAASLNTILSKWLPAEKIETVGGSGGPFGLPAGAAGAAPPFLPELNSIPGLDTEAGFSQNGNSWEEYRQALRQFCSELDGNMSVIAEDAESGNWKDFASRFHAYKKTLGGIGHKALSEWAAALEESAADAGANTGSAAMSAAMCKGIAASVCEAIRIFRDDLMETSILKKNGEETINATSRI
jgi:CheY-like chemotaxis protein/HPt (histidine-containing phosphotransfer) domain-containing protein/anti-sigma regulatory factor (Ser/Thr protein kinase)